MDVALFLRIDWALESESELESSEGEFGDDNVWLESCWAFAPLVLACFSLIEFFFFLVLDDPTSLDSSSVCPSKVSCTLG